MLDSLKNIPGAKTLLPTLALLTALTTSCHRKVERVLQQKPSPDRVARQNETLDHEKQQVDRLARLIYPIVERARDKTIVFRIDDRIYEINIEPMGDIPADQINELHLRITSIGKKYNTNEEYVNGENVVFIGKRGGDYYARLIAHGDITLTKSNETGEIYDAGPLRGIEKPKDTTYHSEDYDYADTLELEKNPGKLLTHNMQANRHLMTACQYLQSQGKNRMK